VPSLAFAASTAAAVDSIGPVVDFGLMLHRVDLMSESA
jgi:hypothetical protein